MMESDDSDLDQEDKTLIRILSKEQRKQLGEIKRSGANKGYIKKKLK